MTRQIAARLQLACAGAIAGALLWTVFKAIDLEWIGEYPALVLTGLLLTGFGGFLAMAGPMGPVRAAPRAAVLGLGVAGLLALTALRYAEVGEFFHNPIQALAAFIVATMPVPFLIAASRTGWRDYPALFLEAWSIVLRFAAAGAFTGLVWLVIYLSDQVLRIVGLEVFGQLLEQEIVPMVLTGAAFGLGVAVVHDLAEMLSPYVVLRLFRLFLPVVLGVMAVFLVALPFRGLDGLVGGLSPAMLLLAMVAAGIALVSIAVDQSDAEATESPVLLQATKAMALVLPPVSGLALYAIWLRVADHGWSPERVFFACVAVLGLGYGLVYAAAVLRGPGWMQRIRRGNTRLALAVIALAALWLTPVLNAERISAQNQLARFEAGRTPVADLDIPAIGAWGRPGKAAVAALEALAQEDGQEALAAALAGGAAAATPDPAALAARLAEGMQLQPATATGTRDVLLGQAEVYQLQDWLQVCETPQAGGRPACVMVVADLLPLRPGEEAMLLLQRSPDYVEIAGLYLDDQGVLQYRSAVRADGRPIGPAEALALLEAYQAAPPPVTAAELNQLGTGEAGLVVLP